MALVAETPVSLIARFSSGSRRQKQGRNRESDRSLAQNKKLAPGYVSECLRHVPTPWESQLRICPLAAAAPIIAPAFTSCPELENRLEQQV
jgi:hypothetical protein